MIRPVFLLLPLLAACSDHKPERSDDAPGLVVREKGNAPEPSRLDSLIGLYESGPSDRRSQMCVVEGADRSAQFALVVHGENGGSCAGSGTANWRGSHVRVAMAGDRDCTIYARVEGRSLVFADRVPAGCSYYCGSGARLAGVRLTQTGSTEADAAKALDPVGDPLCGSSPG